VPALPTSSQMTLGGNPRRSCVLGNPCPWIR
jgi:hypothetical protein